MSNNDRSPSKPPAATPATTAEVEAFLQQLARRPAPAADGRARLMFAMDATASREATWREAAVIQGRMFEETQDLGGLDIQLVYYRGLAECRASRWMSDAKALKAAMGSVHCQAGETQIGRVLRHAVAETGKVRLSALVFVGDCMEEQLGDLLEAAGQLRLLGVPVFLFHEGDDGPAGDAFARIAKMTGGACCRFDGNSPAQLRALLSAVAVYAAGGWRALADFGRREGGLALRVIRQIGDGRSGGKT